MKQKLFMSSLFILAFVLAACGAQATQPAEAPEVVEEATEAPAETVTSAIEVSDQEVADGSVTVPSVTMDVSGWVVIHAANAEGKPGPVVGYAAVAAGKSEDANVSIDVEQVTPQLFAMLHTDAGTAGVYEFPGDDAPVKNGDAVVLQPFNLLGLKAAVAVSDQKLTDGKVTIDSAFMLQPGWVVIHAAGDDGSPGLVIGSTALPAGTSKEVAVNIEAENATPQLFAMLHTDAGVLGTYEFPGDDAPVKEGDAVVMVPFKFEEDVASNNAVTISGFSYKPGNLEIKVGTTITWTNMDGAGHTVTDNDGAFDSGALGQGDSFSLTLDETGVYSYYCVFHPNMTATITVVQ